MARKLCDVCTETTPCGSNQCKERGYQLSAAVLNLAKESALNPMLTLAALEAATDTVREIAKKLMLEQLKAVGVHPVACEVDQHGNIRKLESLDGEAIPADILPQLHAEIKQQMEREARNRTSVPSDLAGRHVQTKGNA